MIEKLKWNDVSKVLPDHKDAVLLWVRSDRPFSEPGWTVGWFEGGAWYEEATGIKTIWVVTHWAIPNGPDA